MGFLPQNLASGLLVLACGALPAFAQDGAFDDLESLFDDLVPTEEIEESGGADDFLLDDLLGEIGAAPSNDIPVATGGLGALRDWKGFVEVRPRVYFDDRSGPRQDEQLLIEAELELDFRFENRWTGYFRPRVFVDAFDGELERFEPYEAYATWSGDGMDVRVGQFVENWGIVDTFNPIDVVNRRDLATDFLDPTRLGELGGRVRWFGEGSGALLEPTWSLYVLPSWRETEFAIGEQRFSFGDAFNPDAGFEPSGSDRALYAVRYAAVLETGPVNADVQALVARGPERQPSLIPSGPDLVPVYFGATTVGLGFRAVPNQDVAGQFLSTLTLKAEIAHKSPYAFDDSPIEDPDDYTAYVLGVDRQFFGLRSDQDQLTLTVEYAGEEGANDINATFRPFRNDLILRGLYEPNDFARSSLELRGIYDFDTDETLGEFVFERQLRSIDEDLKLSVQFQWFDPPGTGESLFDFFPNNTSLAVGLRWDL